MIDAINNINIELVILVLGVLLLLFYKGPISKFIGKLTKIEGKYVTLSTDVELSGNKFTDKYSATKGNRFVGDYLSIGYSTNLSGDIIQSEIKIYQDEQGVQRVNRNSPGYSYEGELCELMNNVYVNYKGIKHPEMVQVIFYNPLHKFDFLIGVASAITDGSSPIAWVVVYIRKEALPEEMVFETKRVLAKDVKKEVSPFILELLKSDSERQVVPKKIDRPNIKDMLRELYDESL